MLNLSLGCAQSRAAAGDTDGWASDSEFFTVAPHPRGEKCRATSPDIRESKEAGIRRFENFMRLKTRVMGRDRLFCSVQIMMCAGAMSAPSSQAGVPATA